MQPNSRPPTGIRLNNPTNMIYVPHVRWQGLANPPYEGRFCHFVSPEYGFRAATKQLVTYAGRGIDTIGAIIPSWAPPSDHNDTAGYMDHMCQWSGIPRDKPLEHTDYLAFFRAMTRQENGFNPYPDAVIQSGINMAITPLV